MSQDLEAELARAREALAKIERWLPSRSMMRHAHEAYFWISATLPKLPALPSASSVKI